MLLPPPHYVLVVLVALLPLFEAAPAKANGFSTEQIQVDVAYLKAHLQKDYRGFADDSDVSEVLGSVEATVKRSDADYSPQDLYWLLYEALAPIVDGHFQMGLSRESASGVAQKFEPYHVAPDCRAKVGRVAQIHVLSDERGKSLSLAFMQQRQVFDLIGLDSAGSKCIKKAPTEPYRAIPRQNTIQRLDSGWDLIRFGNLSRQRSDYRAVFSHMESIKRRNLVFDLRNQSGGSPDIVEDLLVKLGLEFTCPYDRIELPMGSTRPGFSRPLRNFSNALPQDPTSKSFQTEYYHHRATFRARADRYAGKIIALTNRRCASACEGILAMLKNHSDTIAVGQNTSGTSRTKGPDFITLPNTRIVIGYGKTVVPYFSPKNGFIEGRGFLPDVWVEDISEWGIDDIRAHIHVVAR